MKKSRMILGNVVIVSAILALTLMYVDHEQGRMRASRTEAFENMTVAMERVTTNYLVGEQQVCSSWAEYINANAMTAEEAIAFVRDSIAAPDIMGHILFAGDGALTGLSTAARARDPGNYAVSYQNVGIFSDGFEALMRQRSTYATQTRGLNQYSARRKNPKGFIKWSNRFI